MKHSPSDEQVNVISWIPEGNTWGSIPSATYSSPKARKRKLLVACLTVAIGLTFYNPMTSYTTQSFNTVEVNSNDQASYG
jgi:hypothetical protein